jgi:hypothetical protein
LGLPTLEDDFTPLNLDFEWEDWSAGIEPEGESKNPPLISKKISETEMVKRWRAIGVHLWLLDDTDT